MQLRKILVPLDGSELAKQILPYALKLAKMTNSTLVLLKVAGAGEFIGSELELDEVRDVLTDSKNPLNLDNRKIETIVAYEEPLSQIPDIAYYEHADLIMMTTHGRSISRLLFGNSTSNIIHNSKVPLVVLHPRYSTQPLSLPTLLANDPYTGVRPIVLTLDGEAKAEMIVEPAVTLAKATKSPIHLLHVIDRYKSLNYLNKSLYLEPQAVEQPRQAALDYLSNVQTRIKSSGLECEVVIRYGTIAEEVMGYANEVRAQLIAIASHAYTNPASVIFGTVATDLLEHCHQPILMVNVNRYVPTTVAAMYTVQVDAGTTN